MHTQRDGVSAHTEGWPHCQGSRRGVGGAVGVELWCKSRTNRPSAGIEGEHVRVEPVPTGCLRQPGAVPCALGSYVQRPYLPYIGRPFALGARGSACLGAVPRP